MKITEIDFSQENVLYSDGRYIWKVSHKSLLLSKQTEDYDSIPNKLHGYDITNYYSLKELCTLDFNMLSYEPSRVRILCPDCNGQCLSFAICCELCQNKGFIYDYEVDNLLAIGRATVLAYSKGLKFNSDIFVLKDIRSLLHWSLLGTRKYEQIPKDYLDKGEV